MQAFPLHLPSFLLLILSVPSVFSDQTHHQSIKHGASPPVVVSVHKPHGAHHASVASQHHASPQSVHSGGYFDVKPVVAVHAPAAVPHDNMYKSAAVYAAAPAYVAPSPAYVAAAPKYVASSPTYKPASLYHKDTV